MDSCRVKFVMIFEGIDFFLIFFSVLFLVGSFSHSLELEMEMICSPWDFIFEVACLMEAASIFPFLGFPVLSIARNSNRAILEY